MSSQGDLRSSTVLMRQEQDTVIRLAVGLLEPERRAAYIQQLATENLYLAAKCIASCFEDTHELEQQIVELAPQRAAEGLRALVEIGRVELAIERFVQLEKITNEHAEIVGAILRYGDSAFASEFIKRVDPRKKENRRFNLQIIRALDPWLLLQPVIQSYITMLVREMLEKHRYPELKGIMRRNRGVFIDSIGSDIDGFIRRLIEDNSRLENKHDRISMALAMIKALKREDRFSAKEIIQSILEDNKKARDLPTRSALLNTVKSLIKPKDIDEEFAVQCVHSLLESSGVESLELALAMIEMYGLEERFVAGRCVLEFFRARTDWGSPDRVAALLRKYNLLEEFPGSELLGYEVEGTITGLAGFSMTVELAGSGYPALVSKRFFERDIGDHSVEDAIGASFRGKVLAVKEGQLVLTPKLGRMGKSKGRL